MATPTTSLHGKRVAGHPTLQYWGPNNFIRVRIAVPVELVKQVGRKELVKGLATQSVSEAVRRSHDVIAGFQKRIKPLPLLHISNVYDGPAIHAAWVDAVEARILAEASAPETVPLAGYTYEAALLAWVASKGNEPPAPESIPVYRGHLKRLFDRLGHTEMGRVTEEDILTHPQVLLSGSDGGRRCENGTVNNHMASIRSVFRTAKFNRKITHDPTVGTIKKLKKGESARKGFERDQHATIMAKAAVADDAAIKWLWLLGCVMGARIGELADATVGAVRQTLEARWVFDINTDHRRIWGGKPLPLKTPGSTRIVPLHSAIIRLGFLDYVAEVRAQYGDKAALFPMFEPNGYGKLADAASARCMDWLREVVGIDAGPNVHTFHSTRHSIKTYIRGRFDEEIHDAITGHIGKGGVGRSYGETELCVMSEAIELIKVAA